MGQLERLYADELSTLDPSRRAHSIAVGEKVVDAAIHVDAALRADLLTAATLHDIGYGHPASGFHPLDGARYLADKGYSAVVVNLVVMHSASQIEAAERGLDASLYAPYLLRRDLGPAHAVLWWADMTTGPNGQDVTVEERLDEITSRYGPGDVVTRFVERARPTLLAAGHSPIGSIQVPC